MQRTLLIGLCLVVWAVPARPGATPVETAREFEEEGRWPEAANAWADMAEREPNQRTWTGNRLRALAAAGADAELHAVAADAAARFPGWDEPDRLRARQWAEVGEVDDSLALLTTWSSRSLPAALDRAAILASVGRQDEARLAYQEVLDTFKRSSSESPWDRWAAGMAARALGDPHAAARHLELAYRDSIDFLPARLALARLFHERHQANLASSEVTDAGRLSPRHPDVLAVSAELSLQGRGFSRAEAISRAVLELRETDPVARRVLGRLDLVAGLTEDAREWGNLILDRNRWDRGARMLLAGAAYLEGDSTAYHREVDALFAQDPDDYQVFLMLGEILEVNIRNREAEAMYRRLLSKDEDNAVAWSSLGQLAMREGRETEARGYLERAFELDKFNIRAFNQLELLDEMETFTDYDFGDYVFRMDAEKDSLLLPLLNRKMKQIREELVEKHGWTPDRPTIVEIFPTHDWFSARVTGLAWVDGIPGVCFGDVVAMDSPRTLQGRTNWEQVLRHEYGHVLALGMTDRQVPFWFTEGLSVHLEQNPRGATWDANLVGAWWDGEIVSVDSLTIAFTRPKARWQRLLAYHQAGLILGDIEDRHGWEAIPKLLRAFGKGMTLEDAVPEVLGESYGEFADRGYEVCLQRARTANVWPRPDADRLQALTAALGENPDHHGLLVERLLITQMQLGQTGDAAVTAKAILQDDPENPRALGILGLLDLGDARVEAGIKRLREAINAGSFDLPVYVQLGAALVDAGDTTGALQAYEGAARIYPRNRDAFHSMARLHAAMGDTVAARAAYRSLTQVEDSAAGPALEWARMELAAGNGKDADEALEFALGILPLYPDVYALAGRAKLLLGDTDDAYHLLLQARRLDLRNVESMVGMAAYYFAQGDYEESAYFARLALKYDPDHVEASQLLREAMDES